MISFMSVIWFFYIVQVAITTNYSILSAMADSVYLGKVNLFLLRQEIEIIINRANHITINFSRNLGQDVSNKILAYKNYIK